MCDCKNTKVIDKALKRLQSGKVYTNRYGNSTVVSGYADWGNTEVTFNTVKNDGTPSSRRYYIHVAWDFCPHCGEPITK